MTSQNRTTTTSTERERFDKDRREKVLKEAAFRQVRLFGFLDEVAEYIEELAKTLDEEEI
jgi:hypothetical protein